MHLNVEPFEVFKLPRKEPQLPWTAFVQSWLYRYPRFEVMCCLNVLLCFVFLLGFLGLTKNEGLFWDYIRLLVSGFCSHICHLLCFSSAQGDACLWLQQHGGVAGPSAEEKKNASRPISKGRR